MTWNWQKADWPHFRWHPARLAKAEARFLIGSGVALGAAGHVAPEQREQLSIELMSDEAVATSRIEGEVLDRDSVQSSIRRQFGLATDNRRVRLAEQGISEVMVDLYHNAGSPLTRETLFAWHRMVMRGRDDPRDLGRYRTHEEPMQIVSGRLETPSIHFEAPPSSDLPREMDAFIESFNRTAPGGPAPLPALTRAGIAHLYFESIHPFEDGNGRIGRAISEKALAQAIGSPSLTALSPTVLARRASYYEALAASNRNNELTNWLAWFAAVALEAQERARTRVEFVIAKARLLDQLRGKLNPRQQAALLRMLREGPEAFIGGLSAGKYSAITTTAAPTATRDLAELVTLGALTRTGERKGARYHLTIPVAATPRISITESGEIRTD